eukprot:15344026-Ditylum_brightwellii.AAC.1
MNDDYPHPLGHEQERERARARDPILFPAPDLGRCTRAAIGNDRSSQDRNNHSDSDSDSDSDSEEEEEHLVILEGSKEALWLRENLRDTKYGYLWEADVLRRSQQQTTSDEVIWNVTGEKCAVKRSSWEKIRKAKCTEKPEKVRAISSSLLRAIYTLSSCAHNHYFSSYSIDALLGSGSHAVYQEQDRELAQ